MPHALNPEQASRGRCARDGYRGRQIQRVVAAWHHGFGENGGLPARDRRRAEGGRGVVFLVPEVALTPQTVARLRSRLEAFNLAIRAGGTKQRWSRLRGWHSHLSEGERLDGWLALATGEAKVVVGARSAIFAPMQNLKLDRRR